MNNILNHPYFSSLFYTLPYETVHYLSQSSYSFISESYHIALATIHELSTMAQCGWNSSLGTVDPFHLYGANPENISEEDKDKPAIILLHGFMGNQSNFFSLLHTFQDKKIRPIYTFNYSQNERQEKLKQTIKKIQEQYEAKKRVLHVILIGRSFGGVTAVEYTFGDSQVPGVTVEKVITVASRLKITNARFRKMYEDIIPIVNHVYHNLAESNENEQQKLYTITAKRDWLIPREASQLPILHPEQRFEIEDYSHLSVLFAPQTQQLLISLSNQGIHRIV